MTDLAESRVGGHRLLIRRNRTTGELAYYRCWSPAPQRLAMLAVNQMCRSTVGEPPA